LNPLNDSLDTLDTPDNSLNIPNSENSLINRGFSATHHRNFRSAQSLQSEIQDKQLDVQDNQRDALEIKQMQDKSNLIRKLRQTYTFLEEVAESKWKLDGEHLPELLDIEPEEVKSSNVIYWGGFVLKKETFEDGENYIQWWSANLYLN
jgi:hypothetical protein